MTTEGFPDAEDRALMTALKGAISESSYVVETMAAEVGISKESLGRYLRSEREMGVRTFARICQALGMTRAEMYDRAERVLLRAGVSRSITPGTERSSSATEPRPADAPRADRGE